MTTLEKYGSRIVILLMLAASCCAAVAQTSTNADFPVFSVDDNFRSGWHELNLGAGALYSNIVRKDKRPNINYSLLYIQPAYTLTQPSGDGFFRGSLQLAPEISGAYIFDGAGSYVASLTFWLRYDFVPKGWRFVPYVQGGLGATVLDIPQQDHGKSFNFNLNLAAGARYFIRPNCSLNAEFRLQHVSNANIWMHNIGLNASGPVIGVSFFF